MSDADDQMGGSGGETGRRPGDPPTTAASREAKAREDESREGAGGERTPDERVDQESAESFPASDPPSRY